MKQLYNIISASLFGLGLSVNAKAYTDQTDFLPPAVYNRQYAARTECEVPGGNTGPKAVEAATTEATKTVSTPTAVPPVKLSLEERLIKALQGDCGNVRVEKNQIICEDYVKCTKLETLPPAPEADPNCGINEYVFCPLIFQPACIEWQMRERWRFNPNTIGKVDALLIDTQYVKLPNLIALGFAFRSVGKNEIYTLQTENTARQVRNILNYGR